MFTFNEYLISNLVSSKCLLKFNKIWVKFSKIFLT